MWPSRGETARAPGPNIGTMRMLSAQYEITTTPREASGSASGAPTTSFGGGSVPVSGMTWAGLQVGVAFCAWVVIPYCPSPATNNTAVTVSACLSVIMIFAPFIQAAFDMPNHTERRCANLLDHGVGHDGGPDQHHRPMERKLAACWNRDGDWRASRCRATQTAPHTRTAESTRRSSQVRMCIAS